MSLGLNQFLFVSTIIFGIGLFGTVYGPTTLARLLALQFMLSSVNLNLVAFSKFVGSKAQEGHLLAIFIIVVSVVQALALVATIMTTKNEWRPEAND